MEASSASGAHMHYDDSDGLAAAAAAAAAGCRRRKRMIRLFGLIPSLAITLLGQLGQVELKCTMLNCFISYHESLNGTVTLR